MLKQAKDNASQKVLKPITILEITGSLRVDLESK